MPTGRAKQTSPRPALARPTLVETEIVGSLPGAPNGSVAPTPGNPLAVMADLLREYVASQPYAWYTAAVRALPNPIDDVTADFGDDLYERILLDPQAAAAVNTVKFMVLADGVEIASPIADEKDPNDRRAEEIAAYCRRVIAALRTPLDDVLFDMLDATAVGHKVAEQVYRIEESGEDAGMLVLDALKVKPRAATTFVVDAYENVIGLLARIPGLGYPVQAGTMLVNIAATPNLLPREKFAVLTFRPRNNDPRGTSILRPAYNVWWLKQQVWPEYLKFLAQFAGPSVVGITSENAEPEAPTDADGNPTGAPLLTPEQALSALLVALKNGSSVAVPFGTEIKVIEAQGEGRAFREALTILDQQMVKAITSQTLATEEGEHQSRAAAAVHQDVLDLLIRQAKQAVAQMIERDILRPLVRYNFGDAALPLVPRASLGTVTEADKAPQMLGVAAMAREGAVMPSQWAAIYTDLGLPPASAEDLAAFAKSWLASLVARQETIASVSEDGGRPTGDQQPAPGTPAKQAATEKE